MGTIETGDCFGEAIFFGDGALTTSVTVIADEFSKGAIDALRADSQAMARMDKALLLALFKKLKGANEKIERVMLGLR